MAELLLVRHGESDGNAAGCFSGWRDVALTETGRAQSLAFGALLAREAGTMDAVFCSRLQRARDSAEQVLRGLARSDLEVVTDWRLNERHCGAFQGKDKQAVRREFGKGALQAFRGHWDAGPPLAEPGSLDDPGVDANYADVSQSLSRGESIRDLVVRMQSFVRERLLHKLRPGRRVLVVAHAISLRALAYVVEGCDQESLPDLQLQNAQARWYRLDAAQQVVKAWSFGGSG